MRIKILVVGKVKEKAYNERINEFIKWINRDIPIELIFYKDNNHIRLEKKIEPHLRNKDHIICLTEEGKKQSSTQFSKYIFNKTNDLIFLIGGPDGHAKGIKEKASQTISLSKMTFPHEMALLILTEQIYRAIAIKKGSKYHR